LKRLSIAVTNFASWIARALDGRPSQEWKPERETASPSQGQLTGQIWPVFRDEGERPVASRAKKAFAIALDPMAHMAHLS
jgi:hypothetical protein